MCYKFTYYHIFRNRPAGLTDDQIKEMIPLLLTSFPRGMRNVTAINILSHLLEENRYTVIGIYVNLVYIFTQLLIFYRLNRQKIV